MSLDLLLCVVLMCKFMIEKKKRGGVYWFIYVVEFLEKIVKNREEKR